MFGQIWKESAGLENTALTIDDPSYNARPYPEFRHPASPYRRWGVRYFEVLPPSQVVVTLPSQSPPDGTEAC